MRIGKALSGGAVALALAAASGCCQTQYLYRYPDGTEVLLTPAGTTTLAGVPAVLVEKAKPAPAPAPTAVEARTVEVRTVVVEKPVKDKNWWTRGNWCVPCDEKAAAKAVAVKTEPNVLVVESARREVAGETVTVLRRGRKGRVLRALESGQVIRVVEAPAESAVIVPVTEETAEIVSEPVVETVVAEEPSWAKYLAPDQPVFVESAPVAPLAPVPTAEFLDPVVVNGQQPIVIQPIIQPVIQTGQEVLSGQIQAPAMPPQVMTSMPAPVMLPGTADGLPAPVAALPLYAAPAQLAPAPQFFFASDPSVCGPGQNCFTLPEGGLAAGPEVLIPDATGTLTPLTGAEAASVAIPSAPSALSIPVIASAPVVISSGEQDKYGALGLSLEPPRPMERPEVSMPAPLTTTPPVAGTAEIENALDVMLGSASIPALK